MKGWCDIRKHINVIIYVNKLKEKMFRLFWWLLKKDFIKSNTFSLSLNMKSIRTYKKVLFLQNSRLWWGLVRFSPLILTRESESSLHPASSGVHVATGREGLSLSAALLGNKLIAIKSLSDTEPSQ